MRAIVLLAPGLLIAGCAALQAPELAPPQPIICISGADCDAKWNRAATWIAANSSFKLQVHTGATLQTSGPVPSESTPAFTVTKVARGEGRFEITFNGGCGNPYRCVPSIPESRIQFAQFVLDDGAAAAAGATPGGR